MHRLTRNVFLYSSIIQRGVIKNIINTCLDNATIIVKNYNVKD